MSALLLDFIYSSYVHTFQSLFTICSYMPDYTGTILREEAVV